MVLVTGATGRVGEQVVRTLRRLKLESRALVRKGSEYFWLNDTGCSYFFGDLRDELSLKRATRDVEYIIACSGVRWESRENNHTTVTVEGHERLFALAKQRGVRRVVLLSCLGADRGYTVPSFYARKGAEELLIHSGLDYTILRAPLHEQHFLEYAFQVRDRGSATLPGAGENTLFPISTRDLALMLVSSLDLDAARNRTLDVGGAEAITPRQAFERAAAALEQPARGRPLPGIALAIGTRLGRPVRRFANHLDEMSRWFSEDFTIDPDTLRRTFNIPLQDFDAALAAAAQTMLIRRDPALREKHMVHPQFYATVYQPGRAALADMPTGPAPPRDSDEG